MLLQCAYISEGLVSISTVVLAQTLTQTAFDSKLFLFLGFHPRYGIPVAMHQWNVYLPLVLPVQRHR